MAKARILIVEDEALFAMSLERLFKRSGYEVCDVVPSGEEAVASVESQRPDLVIMDVGLAGTLGGMDAAEIIRSCHSMPIVFMTGYVDSQLLDRIKAMESANYINKPVRLDMISQAVEQALADREK